MLRINCSRAVESKDLLQLHSLETTARWSKWYKFVIYAPVQDACTYIKLRKLAIYNHDRSNILILQNALDRGKLLVEKYGPVVG